MAESESRGAIAACERAGAEAGGQVLALGGNAADAAVAAAFAQCVVDPWRCSIGGGAHVLYYSVQSNRGYVIDGSGTVPAACEPNMYAPKSKWENAFTVERDENRLGYKAQLVPGFVRSMDALHRTHGSGRLHWSQLIEPAIRLADDGFPVHPQLYVSWRGEERGVQLWGNPSAVLRYTDESRRIFLDEDGEVLRIGQCLRQSDLANTLRQIAVNGADEFYCGSIAERIHADFAAHGGTLSFDDLESYTPDHRSPIQGTYRGLTLLTEPPPSVGPVLLAAMMCLEQCPLEEVASDESAYLDIIARALALAFINWDALTGSSPDESRHVMGRLELDAQELGKRPLLEEARRAKKAAEERAHRDAGGGRTNSERESRTSSSGGVRKETTHVAVIDEAGNACGITHSVGFGTGLITPGLGFMHNCLMVNFDPRPGMTHSIEPGKRSPCGGGPLIALQNDVPVLSMGSPAGPFKVSAMTQVLSNMLDRGFDLESAIAAKRIHVQPDPMTLLIERCSSAQTAVDLAKRGYEIDVTDYGARVAAVARDFQTAGYIAAADPRSDRGAIVVTVQ